MGDALSRVLRLRNRRGAATLGVEPTEEPIPFGFHALLSLRHRDRSTIARLDYVLHHSTAADTVLTGWSAGLAFRRPAFHYGFPHQEVRTFIPPAMVDALVADLRSGRVHRALVDFDEDLQALGPALVEVVRERYEPSGVSTLWRRRP